MRWILVVLRKAADTSRPETLNITVSRGKATE